ncbi:SUMO-activating enzyme subunit 1 [Kappamyces sp. JEL0829]|nr:SUMO-activating enzyme subunit 1 [Kappamyces sp. JEL0829]
MDATAVKSEDLGAQFLLRSADIGKNQKAVCVASRLGLLNPRVELAVVEVNRAVLMAQTGIMEQDSGFYHGFDMVVVTAGNPDELLHVNKLCHARGIKFWAAANCGFYSFIFSDLSRHDFVVETKQAGRDSVSQQERSMQFCDLQACMDGKGFTTDFVKAEGKAMMRKWKRVAHPLYFAVNVIWRFWKKKHRYPSAVNDLDDVDKERKALLRQMQVDPALVPLEYVQQVASCWGKELSAASAIVGGFLGQEVLKVRRTS